jgi:hypothetical protein
MSALLRLIYCALFLSLIVLSACQPPPTKSHAEDFSGSIFSMPNPMKHHPAQMIADRAHNGEYVKYIRPFPADLIRIEALVNESTPAEDFLNPFYFRRLIQSGVPRAKIIESGKKQTSLGTASYLQVRMTENGSASKGTSPVRVDAIRTVVAINVGTTLLIASRQRDEEGFSGAFDDKKLAPSSQLADLIEVVDTIRIKSE